VGGDPHVINAFPAGADAKRAGGRCLNHVDHQLFSVARQERRAVGSCTSTTVKEPPGACGFERHCFGHPCLV
jgi:hypothetical protein